MARQHRHRPGNLPHQPTSFVGRQREVTDVTRLLSNWRVVATLTGAGGVGKTRLALRVAEESRDAFRDGVWLVRLDALRDQALLAQTVADALGLIEQAGRPAVEVLAEYVADRQLLLVLDSCERLVDASAELVDRLVRAAPELRVLVTGREPLGIFGEATLPVPPLSVPEAQLPVPLSELSRYEAVDLFLQRASSVLPGFALTEANSLAVAEICRLLEGLPLALEMAVARLRALSPEQIRDRLSDRLSDRLALLNRGNSSAPARQQTLRACIDWSHELCTRAERRLWARLSVFAGGFDLAAVEEICGGGDLAADDMLDLVTALVDKSILIRDDQGKDVARYRMLEVMRAYGAERLVELAENERVERRHHDYWAAMVGRAEAAWTGSGQLYWAGTLIREHANIQAAIEYSLGQPTDVEAAQELTARLWFFWIACGYLREGRYYLERALGRGGQGRPRRWAWWACAFVAGSQGDLDVAEALVEQCRSDAAAHGDAGLEVCAAETRAMVLAIRGDPDPAVALLRECIAYYRGLAEPDAGLLRSLPQLGVTLVMRGDFDAALELAPECQQLCERLGEQWQRSYVHYFTGLALHAKGDPAGAAQHFAAAIETKYQFHDIVGMVMCIEPLAGATADLGDGPRAIRLLGAAQQLWQMFGLPSFGSPFHSEEHRRTEQRARELVTAAQYEQAFHEGQAMSLDEVAAYALANFRPQHQVPKPATVPPADPLTQREMEVAELVNQGLTDREIAALLFISTRTAESHIGHILTKLGFTNRTQLASWVAARRGQQHEKPHR